jgi:integrase/recombinase XerD
MTPLHTAVEEYLALRRGLGVTSRTPAALLRRFVTFVEAADSDVITRDLALQWAMLPATAQPATWAWRLGIVRRFAAWRQAADPQTAVPPAALLPHRYHRRRPHIYSDDEIARLLATARRLPSPRGLRALTYTTLFGLLAAAGLRISEALSLDRADLRFDAALLAIRRTKFGKSRLVPLHPSTIDALRGYDAARDRVHPHPATPAFFVSERGRRLTGDSARHTFALVSRQAGLRLATPGRRHGRGPRLHDLRHRFAATTLLHWYRAGRAVERDLPLLATYLGHVHVQDTYWYLEALPDLLTTVATRLSRPCPERLP